MYHSFQLIQMTLFALGFVAGFWHHTKVGQTGWAIFDGILFMLLMTAIVPVLFGNASIKSY